jgi:hypothetical protein
MESTFPAMNEASIAQPCHPPACWHSYEQSLLQGFLIGVYRSIIPQTLLTMLIIVGGMPVHTRLAEAGIAVYGYDHHGHGESEPKEARERALVHDFNHLVCIPAQALLGTQRLAWQSECNSCKPHCMT